MAEGERRARASSTVRLEMEAEEVWSSQSATHPAVADRAAKTYPSLSVDRPGRLAALDAGKEILLVRLSAHGLPVHNSLRHKDAGRWVIGSNVRWCHAPPHPHLLGSTCNSVAFIWNVGATHPVYALREHKRSVNAICWHPTDGTISTCSADSYIHVWDVRTPPLRPEMSFCAWTAGATSIEWCLGDEHVLASSHDNEVRLWDRRKGTLSQPTAFITAHRHSVRSLAWRPGESKELLTVGQDGTVKLWDADEPRECKQILSKQIPYSVELASWAPFGSGLVTVGNTGVTTLWSLPHAPSGSRGDAELERVATLSDQDQLRDVAWRGSRGDPPDRYQLCSVSATGELRSRPIAADWVHRCGHVESTSSAASQAGGQAVHSSFGNRSTGRTQSNQPSLEQAVRFELATIEESATLAGRVKLEGCNSAAGDRTVTARLRIEARKLLGDVAHLIVDVSFPELYPKGHQIAPEFTFDGRALWTDSASANSLLSALQQKVEELAQASVVRHVVCLLNCMDAIVFILDGPLGTGQSSRLGGASDGKFSAERERKGFTPSPVLSAGVFSGPGYFISFNNGIPSRARQGSGTSMPPSPPSPNESQSPLRQLSMRSDVSPLMSPAGASTTADLVAAMREREYQGFLQKLGVSKHHATTPNLSAIVGAAATGPADYDVAPAQHAGFSYQPVARKSASNTVQISDRSFVDLDLAKLYNSVLRDAECSPRECCKHSAVHAENCGMGEVAQTWVLFALTLGSLLGARSTAETEEQTTVRLNGWKTHPLGQVFISDMLQRLMRQGDLQTVAMLSCVLHDAEAQLQPRNQTLPPFAVLPRELRVQCDNFMGAFARLLRCRGMSLLSAAVRARRLQLEPARRPQEPDRRDSAAQERRCAVCRLPVRGLSTTCRQCGHTGHMACMRRWFAAKNTSHGLCPTGCGCQCSKHFD